MNITKIITGELEENCYLIEKDKNVLIVDPGSDYDKIKQHLKDKNVVGILITHYHFDHIGALDFVLNDYKVPVYDYKLEEKEYKILDFNFEIIETKGHTSDSVTFFFKEEKAMFTGDFLFRGTIGRTDLETGNMLEMQESIKKIKIYDDDITVYPGHYLETTLGDEKTFNDFFL